jgi:hypothetical protein
MDTCAAPAVHPGPDAPVPLECHGYRVDAGVELYVAQPYGTERLVASLRIEPVRTASRHSIERLGAAWLPDLDGALVLFSADDDPRGHAALVELLELACRHRGHEPDEAAWIGRCPRALLPGLLAQGWREWPDTGGEPADAVPVTLLLDDHPHLADLGSPLADALAGRAPRPDRIAEILGTLDMRQSGRRRRDTAA